MYVLKQQLRVSGEICCPGAGGWRRQLGHPALPLQDAVAKSCGGGSWSSPTIHLSEKDPVYPRHKKNHLFVTMCGNRWELNLLR